MHTGVFWQILYWFPLPILAIVTGLLLYRGLLRQFPLFFVYMVVACLRDLASLWAYYWSPQNLFRTYWISHLISALFIFLATYELFIKRLFPRFYKIMFYRYLFSVAALAAIALGLSAVLGAANLAVLPKVISTLNFLRVVTLIFLLALMALMGRRWNRYDFGIASGLGVDVAAFVTTFAIFLRSGPLHGVVRELPAIAAGLACLIWLITFLKPEKPIAAPSGPLSPELLTEARKWQEAAKGSVTGKTDPD